MKELKAMVVPVGGEPHRKTLRSDSDGSFLHALQECVGGPVEPVGYLFGDVPAVYVNEEGLLRAGLETANRAVYATRDMVERGYAAREGDLVAVLFGDMACVGFDPVTGEDRDITDAECEKVMERFGGFESIGSGLRELMTFARHRFVM